MTEPTFCNTPNVFTALDDTSIWSPNVLGGANDGEGDSIDENVSMLSVLVVGFNRGRVNSDALSCDNLANLAEKSWRRKVKV